MVGARSPATSPPTRVGGFTLIETLVVMTLLAVLATLAGPSLSGVIAAQRVKTSASHLHLALLKARSEAVKRHAAVTVSPVSGSDWSAGWHVTAGAQILDVSPPQDGVTVTASPGGVSAVAYRADGRTSTGDVMFVLGAAASTSLRCVSIDAAGRPYVKEGSAC